MKQLIMIITMAAAMTACNGKKEISKDPAKEDFTTVIYAKNFNQNEFTTSVAIRQVSDTIKLVGTQAVKVQDTVYRVPILDSARDGAGKIKLDSIGKPVMQWTWYVLDKRILVTDLNSSIK